MAPKIYPVNTAQTIPTETDIVIIGAGIVGLSAALYLSEQGKQVTILEKGQFGAEQSSRNLGWIRKMGRAPADVPMAVAADHLWAQMHQRTGMDVGYRQAGIMYLARTEAEMQNHRNWLQTVAHMGLDSRLVSAQEIDELVPGGQAQWAGGLYTPSDGRAEPTLASSALAKAAIEKGAIVVENCAARTLDLDNGKICGVVTEQGTIKCNQVLLAGGLWSRRFLGNLGINLPILPLVCSVLRTMPLDGPTEIAVGAPDFSFRKHVDGGFIITQRGKLLAPLMRDHLLLGMRYRHLLKEGRDMLRIRLNKYGFEDFKLARRWKGSDISPFEKKRIMDPDAIIDLNKEALDNLAAAWPVFAKAEIEEAWAGMIDITPDSVPVIGPVESIKGLTLATGFSGHGFGTGPAAGHLAAQLLLGETPLLDPYPYRLERF